MRQSRIFVGMVLILIFAEVLGLYGWVMLSQNELGGVRLTHDSLIVALILNTRAQG